LAGLWAQQNLNLNQFHSYHWLVYVDRSFNWPQMGFLFPEQLILWQEREGEAAFEMVWDHFVNVEHQDTFLVVLDNCCKGEKDLLRCITFLNHLLPIMRSMDQV
jgi:hypothetical protein